MSKTLAVIALVILASVSLSGCSDKYATLEERIKNQKTCEDAGGTYTEEWRLGNYRTWDCRLVTVEE
jgi:hypothetical protein